MSCCLCHSSLSCVSVLGRGMCLGTCVGGSISGQRRECLMQSCALSMTKALQWLCRPGLNLLTFKSGVSSGTSPSPCRWNCTSRCLRNQGTASYTISLPHICQQGPLIESLQMAVAGSRKPKDFRYGHLCPVCGKYFNKMLISVRIWSAASVRGVALGLRTVPNSKLVPSE